MFKNCIFVLEKLGGINALYISKREIKLPDIRVAILICLLLVLIFVQLSEHKQYYIHFIFMSNMSSYSCIILGKFLR